MIINLQPILQNNLILLRPLQQNDFEALYKVASDPLIWEQHPNKNRYQKDVFKTFFDGAIQSKGAFLIQHQEDGSVMGSTRFYDYSPDNKSILIGYTFFARKYWGGQYNLSTKKQMLDYAFNFVEKVQFHIGAVNIRSQKSIEKLGARIQGEMLVQYYGEDHNLNFIYEIHKSDWAKQIQ